MLSDKELYIDFVLKSLNFTVGINSSFIIKLKNYDRRKLKKIISKYFKLSYNHEKTTKNYEKIKREEYKKIMFFKNNLIY